jgi:hypothetical protein
MSISFWKAISSPKLNTSKKLLKYFYGHMFQPHGIIIPLPIDLGGRTVYVAMEVINAPLEYNLLLGCTWLSEMNVVFSSVFSILIFPHQGKIVMIDQLAFYTLELGSNIRSNVPFFSDTHQYCMHVGAGMFKYPSLMGIFTLPPQPPTTNVSPVNMILSFSSGSLGFVNPWVVPHLKDIESYGASMPLIMVDIFDMKIPSKSVDTGQ